MVQVEKDPFTKPLVLHLGILFPWSPQIRLCIWAWKSWYPEWEHFHRETQEEHHILNYAYPTATSISWAKRPEVKERNHQLINKPSTSAGGTADLSRMPTYSFPPELFHCGVSRGTSLPNFDGKGHGNLPAPGKSMVCRKSDLSKIRPLLLVWLAGQDCKEYLEYVIAERERNNTHRPEISCIDGICSSQTNFLL